MATLDKRNDRRFALRSRIRVEFGSVEQTSRLEGVTRNVSSGGLLFESPSAIPRHRVVSFTILAQTAATTRRIEFVGEGKVVRVKPNPQGTAFAIAIRCLHPIEYRPVKSGDAKKHPRRESYQRTVVAVSPKSRMDAGSSS